MADQETGRATGSEAHAQRGEHVRAQGPAEDFAAGGGLRWTEAATERLQYVPDGFARAMTRQRIEAFAHGRGLSAITAALVEEKYAEWTSGSEKHRMTLEWEQPARDRVNRIPASVRGLVILEVERCAREMGRNNVTNKVIDRASGTWEKTGAFHSETHLKFYEESSPTTAHWSPEAEERLQRVPMFVREMARKGVERYAKEQGCQVITEEVMVRARREMGM